MDCRSLPVIGLMAIGCDISSEFGCLRKVDRWLPFGLWYKCMPTFAADKRDEQRPSRWASARFTEATAVAT